MKQNARYLLVGTVVKSPDGDKGILRMFRDGKWYIDFEAKSGKWVSITDVQKYELI